MRKKFTMLLALLSLMTAASAQVLAVSNAPADGEWDENTTWYLIRNKKGGYVSSAADYVNENGYLLLNNTTKPTGDDALWCVVGNEADGYKFYNKSAGVDKILCATGTLNSGDPSMIMNDATASTSAVTCFDIAASQKAGYVAVKDHGSDNNYWNHRDGNLAYWNSVYATNDDGSSFVFATEAEIATALAALTASVQKANDELTASGLDYASNPITLQVTTPTDAGYISCSNIDSEEGNDMNFLIDNDPSTFIHTSWHSISSTKDYLDIYLGEGEGVSLLQFSEITRGGNAQADFPVSIEILGRAADDEEYTTVATVSGLPAQAGASYTSPVIECNPSYIYLRFIVTGSHYAANRPYWHMAELDLYSLELDINEEYKAAMSEYVALFDNIEAIEAVADDANADLVQLKTANESLQSYLLAIDVALNPEKYALMDRIEELSAYLSWGGTAVGYYPEEKIAALSDAIDAAQAVLDNEESTADNYAAALITLDNTFSGLDLLNSANRPESDKYYTIRNAYSGVYMNVNDHRGLISTNDGIDMGEVFQFVPAADGKFYLKQVERGVYLSSAPAHQGGQASAAVQITATAIPVTITNFGIENRVSIVPDGGATLHHDVAYSKIVGWDADANSRSAWKIEEVEDITALSHPVTITDVEWATLILAYNAVIPEGVTAYVVSSAQNGVAQLTKVNDAIPAYTAVLLNGSEGRYDFKFATSADAIGSGLLKGLTFNAVVLYPGSYVLSAPNGPESVGLYKAKLHVDTDSETDTDEDGDATNDYTGFATYAFKAFLPGVSVADASAPMFSFDRGEGTTKIENTELNIQPTVIYDLLGRRVEKMEKGIYIVNGKKIIK